MSIADKIKTQVDAVFANPNLAPAVAAPEVFRGHDQQAAPSQLQEWAMFVASQREFVAEMLQEAAHTLKLVDAIITVTAAEAGDELDAKLSTDAAILVNRGFAAQERVAHAKVSQVQRMVDLRAAQMQRERLGAVVQQLEHVHREWRSAEFTLDRFIRLTQLRLQMSET